MEPLTTKNMTLLFDYQLGSPSSFGYKATVFQNIQQLIFHFSWQGSIKWFGPYSALKLFDKQTV